MSFNFSAIIVGPPGCGKTTLASALVRRHLETTKGIVLAFDPVYQYGKHGCASYKDVAAWRTAAIAASTEGAPPMPRGASIGGDSEAITRLALELGERLNRADDVRVPILVPYDEASLLSSSGSTYMGSTDNEMLAVRRHRGVAPIYNVQQPKQITARFFSMATDVYLFRQTTDRARELDGLLLLEKGELARAGVTRLPEHRYLHVRMGVGIVGDAL